jgi:hypothetical protein
MVGYIIGAVVGALLLRFCVSLVTRLSPEQNSFVRALVTSIVLMAVSALFGLLGPGRLTGALALGSWLFVVKSAYDVSWGRAFGVWLLVAGISVGIFLALFAVFGVLIGGLSIL